MKSTLVQVYHRLLDAFGPQHWWPGESPFEVMVGAVLTQNTSWQNVERAIDNLREADLLEPHAPVRRAGGRTGGTDPAGRLLPRQGPAAAEPAGVSRRALRRLAGRHVPHPAGRASRGAARRPRHRAGDGRLDPALCRRSCRASWSTPTRIASSPGTAGSASTPTTTQIQDYFAERPAARRAAVQRVSRPAGAAGQGLLPQDEPEVRRVPASASCSPPGGPLEPDVSESLGRRTGGRN